MPYHQEGGRDSRGIPEFECILEEEQQAYLNAIEPFGGEMLRRKSLRLSQKKILAMSCANDVVDSSTHTRPTPAK